MRLVREYSVFRLWEVPAKREEKGIKGKHNVVIEEQQLQCAGKTVKGANIIRVSSGNKNCHATIWV